MSEGKTYTEQKFRDVIENLKGDITLAIGMYGWIFHLCAFLLEKTLK